MSSAGSDAKISGSKIEPLDSEQKEGVPRDESTGGAAGTDINIDQARLNPVGGRGQYQNPESHAEDQGAVGRDSTIGGAKIDPLVGQTQSENTKPATGLTEEEVDSARIEPMGDMREELPRS